MTRPPEPRERAEVDAGPVDPPAEAATPVEPTPAEEPLAEELEVPRHDVPSDEAAWERAARAAAHDDAPLGDAGPTDAYDDEVAPPTRLVPRVAPAASVTGDLGSDPVAAPAGTTDDDAADRAVPPEGEPEALGPAGHAGDGVPGDAPVPDAHEVDAPEVATHDLDAHDPGDRDLGPHHDDVSDGPPAAPTDEVHEAADGAFPLDAGGTPPGVLAPDPASTGPGTSGPAPVPAAHAPVHAPAPGPAQPSGDVPPPEAWRTLGRSLRPRVNRAQVLAGLLCGMLGFAVVVQVRQTHDEGLSTLRQSELVGILDQTTRQGDELEREADSLERTRQKLLSGSTSSQAALDAAMSSAATQGILAGRLPAEGPGLSITVADPDGVVAARSLLNLLEELRNAGAEAVQLNDLRITASSYVVEGEGRGVVVDGVAVEPPYRWLVIGDPATMGNAMEIPGGAFATIRNDGGRPTAVQQDELSILATRTVPEPRFATPLAPEEG
ncbi:DUF881 domain-containing protein [Cellulomonas sp. NS3]|uniref:DUF881 domain-containing protein n=1 Tax=Cellulomonas sp. NS3 TaxID=2973977 RepID=UPI002162EFB6|nr:DUF881 domain-containing protein [Cellulomonas sp. NS3]